MHEVGLCEDLLAAVERRAAGRSVARVALRVGTLHRVVEPALAQAFEMVSAGGVAEGATIDLVVVPATAVCRACSAQTSSADAITLCARCGSTDVEQASGDELLLESITLATTS